MRVYPNNVGGCHYNKSMNEKRIYIITRDTNRWTFANTKATLLWVKQQFENGLIQEWGFTE